MVHAVVRHRVHQRHQSGPLQAYALRRGKGFCAGGAGRRDADLAAGAPIAAGTDVKSLVALLKANPGKYNYGSSGLGSILHLCGEEFKAMAGGLDITHVPYKGSAPMDTDLMGGQVAMAFDATPTAMPLAQSGKLRALGAGMLKRLAAMPDYDLGRAGLEGLRVLHLELDPGAGRHAAADRRQAQCRGQQGAGRSGGDRSLKKTGVDPTPGSTPATTAEFVKAELAKWAPIIKASGAQVD